jgi:hypothetical protein
MLTFNENPHFLRENAVFCVCGHMLAQLNITAIIGRCDETPSAASIRLNGLSKVR